jgi:hypothetical protein
MQLWEVGRWNGREKDGGKVICKSFAFCGGNAKLRDFLFALCFLSDFPTCVPPSIYPHSGVGADKGTL